MKYSRLISISLLITMLVSCSAPIVPEDTDVATDTPGTVETATETTPAETEPPFAVADLGGREFIILARDVEGSQPCEADMEENGEVLTDAIAKRNAAVEEALKIRISVKPVTRSTMNKEVKNALQSGVEAFDIGLVNYNCMSGISGLSGALMPLDSIQTLDLEAAWWDSSSLDAFKLKNNGYVVVGDLNLNATTAIYGLLFNQKIVKDNNMTSPYELVSSGKWTMDAMYTMMQKAQKDLNGDTVMDDKDQYGLICTDNTFMYMFYHTGEELVRKNAAGNLEVNKTQRLYDVVDRVLPITVMGHLAGDGLAASLQPFFAAGQALFYQTSLQSTFELRNMEMDYGIIPGPKADENQANYSSPLAASYTSVLMVPSWNKDAEEVGTVLNALGYYSRELVTPALYESVLPAKLSRDETSLRMLEIMNGTKMYAINAVYNFGKTNNVFKAVWTAQTNTMASEMAKLESAATKAIANLMAKQE